MLNVLNINVLNKYANINDVISLNWLPINENIQFSTVKMTYLALRGIRTEEAKST